MTRATRQADGGEVAELEMMTRALIGITLQSLEVLGHAVSLPQFRLLLAASALGRAPSSRLAEAAGVPASSVTRLADKLAAAGLLARGTDEHSRSIVTIEVTEQGRDLVARVVSRRHELLAAVLARMTPDERELVAASAARFTALAADAAARGATGPLPLLPAAAVLVPAVGQRPLPGPAARPAPLPVPRPAGARLSCPARPAADPACCPCQHLSYAILSPVNESTSRAAHLGDFTLQARSLFITAAALAVGGASAVAAWCLLRLIGLITNAVFYQRASAALTAPGAHSHPFWLILLAPVAGGLAVGLMARYGSEKIRGHGMPETIDAIVTGGSKVSPRVALLKPVSAAVSIGTGGPFGAEGPIIMTGGAVGSILAQCLHLSADERKALLVAGAAGGMAATFNAPLAAILLAVELLLFEWRPRSLIPVCAAVTVATVCRWALLGSAMLFPVSGDVRPGAAAIALTLVPGLSGGLLAVVATGLVYKAEDAFARLPVHWMWWPAIGGLIIGVGALFEPRALGVGYDVIGQLLSGRAGLSLIVGILVVKTLIWSLSLGSGTSGGVLAPTFMIGGALGALEGHLLPPVFAGFWAMAGLAAVVGGVMRSPLTGIVFTLELTGAWDSLLGLLVASVSAYALSALVLKRSVLTEKVARRGIHLTREYSTDPLEVFFASEVMTPAAPSAASASGPGPDARERPRVTVYADSTLREVANELARRHATTAAVTDRAAPSRVVGEISLGQLLHARRADLHEDEHRERPLPALVTRAVPSRRERTTVGRG